jgi:hypothetical protein
MRTIATVLSSLALLFALLLLAVGQSAQSKQSELARQQDEINKGSLSQQVGVNLLKEMASVATGNPRMRELLQANGYTLTINTNQAAPKPAAR